MPDRDSDMETRDTLCTMVQIQQMLVKYLQGLGMLDGLTVSPRITWRVAFRCNTMQPVFCSSCGKQFWKNPHCSPTLNHFMKASLSR